MATYLCGPSVLRLTGHADPVQPGETFTHDFGVDGPEGEHGPDREAALLAAGAMTVAPAPVVAPTASIFGNNRAPAAVDPARTDGTKE